MKPIWMKLILGIACGLTIAIPAWATTPAHFWSRSGGGTGNDIGYAIATDGFGNTYVGGQFRETADFGGGPLTSAGADDAFLVKYDPAGNHVWSMRMGSTGTDLVQAMVVDAAGNVCITGYFQGSVFFGGAPLVSAGGSDVFLARYSPSGTHLWNQRMGGTSAEYAADLQFDLSGNLILAAYTLGNADFGGGYLGNAGGYDVIIASYTVDGAHLWSQRKGAAANETCNSMAVDGSGNIVLTGTFANNTANFGGSDLPNAGYSDVFLAKFDLAGGHLWSHGFGSSSDDIGYSVACDGAGNVIVTGSFAGTVDFGGGYLTTNPLSNPDIFLAKYDAAGAHQWSRSLGGIRYDVGRAVMADDAGDIFFAGDFQGSVNFGGVTMTTSGSMDSDVVLARFDAGGNHVWSAQFGGTDQDWSLRLVLEGSDRVAITGHYSGTANFGGLDLTAVANTDVFVGRYATTSSEPAILSISDVGNDEGRKVRIQFSRSGFDMFTSTQPVTSYEVYRRADALPSLATGGRALRDDGWVYAGRLLPHGSPEYLVDAPTDADSTILLGQYHSTFFVRAATNDPLTFFDSPPDSGYSVDNLAPDVPNGLLSDTGLVSWNRCRAADLKYYTVYGSPTQNFGDAVLFDYTTDTSMNLKGSGYSWAFVTATDFSGNESSAGSVKVATGIGGYAAVLRALRHQLPQPVQSAHHGGLHRAVPRQRVDNHLRRARRARGDAGGQRSPRGGCVPD